MEELFLNSGVKNIVLGYEQLAAFDTITHQDGSGAAFSITARLAGTYSLEGKTITGILTLNGSSGDDTLIGSAGDDHPQRQGGSRHHPGRRRQRHHLDQRQSGAHRREHRWRRWL
jgi:hypothetical protein